MKVRKPATVAPRLARAGLALAACLPCTMLRAQEAGVPRSAALTPTFSAEESLVDTRYRPSGGNGLESQTRVSPGLRYDSRSGRVQGSLDYAANLVYRSGRGTPADTELQNSLSARFIAEAITNLAFIEAQASIAQQSLSAFGQQSLPGDLERNTNRTEVLTASLTPSLRGRLGSLADFEARVAVGGTLVKDSPADSQNTSTTLRVHSPGGGSMLSWSVSGTQQRVHFRESADTLNERLAVDVMLRPVPELQFTASGGREADDAPGRSRELRTNYGGGLKWTPNPRTRLELESERRVFGDSRHVVIEHRLPRSVLSYSLTRDITSNSNANGVGQPLTRFDVLYALEASMVPDPDLRRAQVLDELRAAGLDPNEIVSGGFVTGGRSLQQRQDLSFSMQGVRGSLSLTGFISAQRLLDGASFGDVPAGETVRQIGYTATVTHRLTPQSSLNLIGSRLKTLDTPTRPGIDLRSASIRLSTQTGPRTTTQLGVRYSVFHSPTDPYKEAAVNGSLSLRF